VGPGARPTGLRSTRQHRHVGPLPPLRLGPSRFSFRGGVVANQLNVDPTRVDRVAGQIASSTADFAEGLQQVDDQVRNLVGTGWKGDPGSQFHDAFADWHDGAAQVVEGMQRMTAELRDVAASFRVQDGQ
jgi:WXG100 family type VII secretion target